MALDSIIIGCSWDAALTVGPTSGRTPADVVADLTGATAVALLYGGGVLLATFGASVDAPARTIGLSLTPADTGPLAQRDGCVIDVRVTASDGRVLPVVVRSTVAVRRLTDG